MQDSSGNLDLELHEQFLAKEEEIEQAEKNHFQCMIDRMEWEEEGRWLPQRQAKKARSSRKFKSLRPHYFDGKGNLKFLEPRETVWYHAFCRPDVVDDATMDSKLFKKFRGRFRMPYEQFRELLLLVQEHQQFARWTRKDASGSPPSPMGLLVLGSLR